MNVASKHRKKCNISWLWFSFGDISNAFSYHLFVGFSGMFSCHPFSGPSKRHTFPETEFSQAAVAEVHPQHGTPGSSSFRQRPVFIDACSTSVSYCWWKESCTTWDVWNPGIMGYLPYQLVQDFFQQQYVVSSSQWHSGTESGDSINWCFSIFSFMEKVMTWLQKRLTWVGNHGDVKYHHVFKTNDHSTWVFGLNSYENIHKTKPWR